MSNASMKGQMQPPPGDNQGGQMDTCMEGGQTAAEMSQACQGAVDSAVSHRQQEAGKVAM